MGSWVTTFRVSIAGIVHAFRTERNMRVHAVMAVVVIMTGLGLNISMLEWLWIGLAIILVIAAELLNTAIEALVDLNMPHPHPVAKVAKDTAAGAVFVTAVFAVIVGVIIFVNRICGLHL